PAVRRVYFVSQAAGLRAFDMDTFVPVGALPIAGIKGTPSSLVRWSANGLAFRTNAGEVFLVRSDLVPSSAPTTGPPVPTPTTTPTPTPVPATTRLVQLPTSDIIYDPSGGKIYASVPGNSTQSPHSLVPVDPTSGNIGTAVFVGNEPGQLAISDNSQYIYVAKNSTTAPGVWRFNVGAQAGDLQFELGGDSFHGKYFVGDMAVLPGNPSALAVARRNITGSDGDEGVAIYDNGVQRPTVTAPKLSSLRSALEATDSPSTLYLLNRGVVDRFAVDAGGVTSPADGMGIGVLGADDMKFAAGRLYGSTGRVLDTEVRALVGTYARLAPDFGFGNALPDVAAGRVYLVSEEIAGSDGVFLTINVKLRAYDMWTYRPVGEAHLGNVRGRVGRLIRWGARGFALRTDGGSLLIAETDLATASAASSVQFASANYSGAEGGKVQVTVTRGGDVSGAAEVTYATTDLSARDTGDYSAAVGTLRFGPNEQSKSFDVLLNDDALAEGEESFNVALGNTSGATLGPLSVVTVKIADDDATSGPSPVKLASLNAEFFVRQHYADFLNREPDASGLAFWTNEIEGCGADAQCREVKRINVSAAFFLSIEFQETGYLAYRAFKAAYGDATSPNVAGTVPVIRLRELLADAGRIGQGVRVGIGDWERQLDANKNAYALEFVRRQRFADAYPLDMSADAFVTKLDQNAGGVLSTAEKDQLVATLGAAPGDPQKRAAVLRAVADDDDLRRAELNRAFVLMQYHGYLRRNPDDPQDTDFRGWKFWLDKLNEFDGNYVRAEMVKAFLDSAEYGQRFGL
ncbi:MAG: Calx-beta domain-containing protein, partial [Pyrinomonadaceae bacterium]